MNTISTPIGHGSYIRTSVGPTKPTLHRMLGKSRPYLICACPEGPTYPPGTVHVREGVCAWMPTGARTYMNVHISVQLYACIYIHRYRYRYRYRYSVCMYLIGTYVYIIVCTCMYIYIYTHTLETRFEGFGCQCLAFGASYCPAAKEAWFQRCGTDAGSSHEMATPLKLQHIRDT